MQKHNNAVDLLRFFAALMVVLFHLSQAIEPVDNWYRNTVKHGWLGVAVFFVISGYCILSSAQHSANFKDFLSRRFFRIYPAYWVSLVVVLLAACVQKLYIGSNAVHNLPRTFSAAAATIALTTAPLTKIDTINWVYWSLTCELLFYLTVGIILLTNKKYLIYGIFVVSVISLLVPQQHTGLFFFLDLWPPFGLGSVIFFLTNEENRAAGTWVGCLMIANLAALVEKFYMHPAYICITIAAFAVILSGSYLKLRQNLFSNLGKYSYSVYLLHVPVGVFMLGLIQGDTVKQNPVLNLIYDLAVYGIISLLAWGMFNRIEYPAIHFGRRFSQNYYHAKVQRHPAE